MKKDITLKAGMIMAYVALAALAGVTGYLAFTVG